MEQVQCLRQSARCSDDSSGFHLVVCRTHLGTVFESSIRQHQIMLPDVAERLVGPSTLVSANIRFANSVSCQGIVGCLLGAAFAAPASGRAPLTEREILTRSVGGYKKRLHYEAPHEMQLSCVDLDPDEHNENAQCVVCLDNIEERGDINVLVMECGHWVCASIDCRPKRNSKWNQRIGRDEEVDLECPRCCYLLEPGHEKMRLSRKRVLRFPFCVGRPSEPPNYLGRDKREIQTLTAEEEIHSHAHQD